MRTRTRLAVLLTIVLPLAAGSCSDDDEAENDYEACADWAQLRESVNALTDVDVIADGTNALRAAADDVADAVDQLQDSAGQTIDDEVDALGSAVEGLTAEIADLPAGEGEAGTGLVAVGGAVQDVSTAAQDLGAQIESGCS